MTSDQDSQQQSAAQERLQDELTAVQSIYPEQVQWLEKNREFQYRSVDGKSSYVLRIPDRYLIDELPEVITANAEKTDLRDDLRRMLKGWDPTLEALDAVLEEFIFMADRTMAGERDEHEPMKEDSSSGQAQAKATVAVWLHHLLNTNKRKQAITPTSNEVSGYSKPGYPGVLLYTGPASAVHAHVTELKSLRWQAFQVRLEVDEEWSLPHTGVVEVESMSDIMSGLQADNHSMFSAAIMRL